MAELRANDILPRPYTIDLYSSLLRSVHDMATIYRG